MSHAPTANPIEHGPGGHSDHGGHGDSGHVHPLVGHLVPTSTLVATGLALLALTIITVAVRYIDVGEFNLVVALAVAVVKGTLVALFFMHLRWDRPFNGIMFVGCMFLVALMMCFCVMDTSEYRPLQYVGNPPTVETELKKEAPNAPVAKYTPYVP